MALARIARNGYRRSGGALAANHVSEKDSLSHSPALSTELTSSHKNGNLDDPCEPIRSGRESGAGIRFRIRKPEIPDARGHEARREAPVVVLGSGWAACRFLKGLDTRLYDVVCISPRNHMVFTPLLASTCVGTLEFRSVAEPVSQIQEALAKDPNSYFFPCFLHRWSTRTSMNFWLNQVYCETAGDDKVSEEPYRFKVSYDKLVIASGSEPLTFGIKGVKEHAFFLREVSHAQEIRKRLLLNLMLSQNPGITEEEKERLLHCVVIGGGPTGVEFSGELSDFIMRDVRQRYAHVKNYIRVTLIEANEILSSFDVGLREYATKHLTKYGVRLVRGVVKEVHADKIVLSDGSDVPYGLLVWSTGVGPSEFVKSLKNLPKSPGGRIGVDEWLRVPAVEDVFALGELCWIPRTGRKALCFQLLPSNDFSPLPFQKASPPDVRLESDGLTDCGKALSAKDIPLGDPFVYKHLGSMASVGRYKALVDLRQSKGCKGFVDGWVLKLARLALGVSNAGYQLEEQILCGF
ncbi:internal alternative NAD(P)H-ubiquinone oxidoreductase a2 mitochondrial [Phtheirospermum japonicum]|uniref:Internal alternative NAD(P)H-ubiquinone oxidoreductase a2 mitochondrial n=1 Tax=Phtheirospermum japonicum TaxID=374723 RepID=A0A830DCS8_9LAMI|nr:internal alternative NAD(P)H-ubiquinone oxidoreductase a2 mitochondrial [Phtheirospermum japonicum]